MLPPRPIIHAALIAVLCVPAFAQQTGDYEPIPERLDPPPGLDFTLSAALEHRFETDIDGGGEISRTRYQFGLGAERPLSENIKLSFFAGAGIDDYGFDGVAGLGGLDPWEDITTIGAGAVLAGQVAERWTMFGGPLVQMSWENGASADDGLIGGGFLAASCRVSDRLTLGGGLGAVSGLEDGGRIFPIIVVDWRLRDDLRLSSRSGAQGFNRSGLELVWAWQGDWELAVGAAYETRRFRLDDDGPAPGGVGEETSVPIWLRATWVGSETFRVDLFAGLATAGELTLENDEGHELFDRDYDPAMLVGASVEVRF